MSTENICARCHAQGTGCCQLSPEHIPFLFGLMHPEIERIAGVTGMKPEDFTVSDIPPMEFYRHILMLHPLFEATMTTKQRIRLRLQDNRCVFLGQNGCLLPVEVRPFYCRLYPVWFDMDDKPFLLRSKTCLAQNNAISIYQVIRRLDTTETHLFSLFREFSSMAQAILSQRKTTT